MMYLKIILLQQQQLSIHKIVKKEEMFNQYICDSF